MAGKTSNPKIHCSFCGKTQEEVRKLIAGPNGVYICDECIDLCSDIISEELEEMEAEEQQDLTGDINLLKPAEIKAFWMNM